MADPNVEKGSAATAGSDNVSAGTTGSAGATGITHAALRQQIAAMHHQFHALQVAIASGTQDPNTAASKGGPTTGAGGTEPGPLGRLFETDTTQMKTHVVGAI